MAKGRFSGARQRHVALLLDLAGPLGLAEILEVVGGDRGSLERSLRSLDAQGLLSAAGTEGGAAPGRAARLWSLTAAGSAAVPRPRTEDIGLLTPGSTWVYATALHGDTTEIEHRLADGRLLASASWIVRLDGAGHSYLVAFPSGVGAIGPQMLLQVLRGVADCWSGTVRSSETPKEFMDVVRRAERTAHGFAP